jgi:hypothetical protein
MKEAALTQVDFQYFSQDRTKAQNMEQPIPLEVEN